MSGEVLERVSEKVPGKILVFARTPQLGQVKTRLKTTLGDEGCLALHKKLASNTVRMAAEANLADVEVWHTGSTEHACWQDLSQRYDITLREQCGGDLGARMLNAATTVLSNDEAPTDKLPQWAIIIGSDCPEIDKEYLSKAITHLESGSSVVVGPAVDGGYVLIGLSNKDSDKFSCLFGGIEWGSETVLQQTLERAAENDLSPQLLDALRDLDDEDDWHYFRDLLHTS